MGAPAAKLVIRGFGRMVAYNAETGEVEGEQHFENMIVDDGISDFFLSSAHSDVGGSAIGYAGIGSGSAAPASNDTALANEFETRKTVAGSIVATHTLQSTWSYGTGEATQSQINEVGLFRTNTAGAMAARATVTGSTKTTNQTLAFTWNVVLETSA